MSDTPPEPVMTRERDVFVIDLGEGDNRLSPTVLAALDAQLDEVEDAEGARALVIGARGKVWSNGLDLDWIAANPDGAGGYLAGVHDVCARVLTLGVPTVAAVTGHAFGAGALLALCHDHRVMRADRGFWCLPEVDLGMTFTPGFQAIVTAKLTPSTTNEAVTTGRRWGGDDAMAAGIVDEAVPEHEVRDRAVAVAAARAAKATGSIAGLKEDLYSQVVAALHRGIEGSQ